MNIQFSRSLSGFNREEVIEYIKKLTLEKSRAEKETFEIANRLDEQEDYIDKIRADLKTSDERVYQLETEINEKDALIEQLRSRIQELSEELGSVNEEKVRKLSPVRLKIGSAEADLRNMASELSAMAQRVERAYAASGEAAALIDEYTDGADENGNI